MKKKSQVAKSLLSSVLVYNVSLYVSHLTKLHTQSLLAISTKQIPLPDSLVIMVLELYNEHPNWIYLNSICKNKKLSSFKVWSDASNCRFEALTHPTSGLITRICNIGLHQVLTIERWRMGKKMLQLDLVDEIHGEKATEVICSITGLDRVVGV